ncbi:MAG: peptidoglycan-binding protein [Candidatus Pacebacteria bacterium]|nr:peptidoglycan-binding protein [Candidatus Paceibacterota bacterium]
MNSTTQAALRFVLSFRSPIILILIICLVTGVPRGAFAAGTWTESNWQSGVPVDTLEGIASSANGQDLVVGTLYNDDVWMSTDYGVTWNQVLTGADSGNHSWSSFAISADGNDIVGAQSGGYIWLSTNGGAGWVAVDSDAETWTSVTMSANGEYMAAAAPTLVQPVISSDYGSTWSAASGLTSAEWRSVSYSPDGNYLIVGGDNSGTAVLGVTLNHGLAWSVPQWPDLGSWNAVAVNDQGDMLEGGPTYLYLSTDAGESWVPQDLGDANSWTHVSISNDGSTMAVTGGSEFSGSLYLTTDGGTTWNQQDLSGTQWNGLAVNSDGTRIAAVAGYATLFTYADVATPTGGSVVDTAHSVPAKPVLAVNDITTTSAVAQSGTNEQNGITHVGIAYGTNSNSLVHKDLPTNGTIQYSLALTGLSCGTTYQVAAYATNALGTTYSDTQNFTTLACAVGGSTTQSTSTGSGSSSGSSTSTSSSTSDSTISSGGGATTTPATASSTPSAAANKFIFTRDLKLGMSGTDVQALQHFLNTHGFPLAATGTGSLDNETTYFGKATKAALAKYQASVSITPSVGYFGSITRAKVNQTN